MLGCVCSCFRLRLCPATLGWGERCWCVCLGSGFGCAQPLLAGVLGCVCMCANSACTPQLLAGVCGVWFGCCLAPVLVPWFVACCACCPRLRHPVAVVAWYLSVCRGCGRRRASLVCLLAWRWCPGSSSSPFALRAPAGFPDAVAPFPIPGACAPAFTGRLRGACGGQPRTGLFVSAAGPCRSGGTGLAPRRTRSGPRDGFVLPGSSSIGLGLRALRWFACMDPFTDASGLPYRPSFDGGLGRCTGAVLSGRRHRPFSGRRTPRPGPVRVCLCVPLLAGSGELASRARFGAPHPFLWSGLVRSLFVRPPPGWGCPVCGFCWGFLFFPSPCGAPVVSGVLSFPAPVALGLGVLWSSRLPPPFLLPVFHFDLSFFLVRLRCLRRSVFSGPGGLGLWRLVVLPPAAPPFFFFLFFFFSLCALLSLVFRGFQPGLPWALASFGPPSRPPSFFFPPSPSLFFFLLAVFLFFGCFPFFFFLFPYLPFSLFALLCQLRVAWAGVCVLGCGMW